MTLAGSCMWRGLTQESGSRPISALHADFLNVAVYSRRSIITPDAVSLRLYMETNNDRVILLTVKVAAASSRLFGSISCSINMN